MNAVVTTILDAARGLLHGHELSIAIGATLVLVSLTLSGATGQLASWAQTHISRT